jgi:hypothetical protein
MIGRRRHTRYSVRLPCRIELAEYSLRGLVVDLSRSGARLELPFAGNTEAFWSVSSILIEAIGRFEAQVRWQSGNILGLAFQSPGDRVERYLLEAQLRPVEETP